jgi:protein-histidine N-methyltransferase
VLFQYAITQVLPLYFTFTDYNADVLELVTFPNLFLTWVSTLNLNATSSSTSSENENENTLLNLSEGATGDLDITPELKVSFIEAMKVSQINLTFVSGSWLPADPWICLIPTSSQMNTLILASETIYSPSALRSFTTAMVGILKAVRLGKAMIAAKRVYFGVGGSVDAFKVECAEQGAVAAEIENHGVDVGQGEGIRRCLLEVQMM